MQAYLLFALKRLIQFIAVVFAGCSAAFFISHLSPISPVDQIIGRVSGQSSYSPEAITALRATLEELFGLNVPLHIQYFNFLGRLATGDFGPALPEAATITIPLAAAAPIPRSINGSFGPAKLILMICAPCSAA